MKIRKNPIERPTEAQVTGTESHRRVSPPWPRDNK
jgi:hypothetical protein